MNEIKNKKYVYHRALNGLKTFENFISKNKTSSYTLVAEGDLCWADIDGKLIIYIHHPSLHGKSLSAKEVKSLYKKNELLELEQLFSIDNTIHYILELKHGSVDIDIFFKTLKNLINKYEVKNILVDAFSAEYLKKLRKVIPTVKTSLHTKLVFDKYILETTFEKPYINIHNVYKLDFVDYITLSYETTHVNMMNLDIDMAYKHIYKSGKGLNLGAIKTIESFKKAIGSKVEYIYLRSDEVLNNYERELNNENNT